MDERTRDDAERGSRRERALQRLRGIARLFDEAFGIPGTRFRFGIDALFGLVPGIGDLAGALVAVYALHVARLYRAPVWIQLHMLANITVDALVGTIPVLGDIFDFFFRAQSRNVVLLEDWLATPHQAARRSRRGLLMMSLSIVAMFASLTIVGIWMLWLFFRWIGSIGQ